jgi:hypothetical protein
VPLGPDSPFRHEFPHCLPSVALRARLEGNGVVHQRVAFAAACVWASVFGGELAAVPSDPPARVQIAPGAEQRWVLTALDGVVRRLSDPRCQEVLSDYTDASGRTLLDGLTARGQSAIRHLHDIWFLNGESQPLCTRRTTSAFTVPAGRLIFMCPRLFRRSVGKYDELLVIHEVLHTLGLGENPPSSDSITRQVAMRCGGV